MKTKKIVIQRVLNASVTVNNKVISRIGRGLCILVGIRRDDTIKDSEKLFVKNFETKIKQHIH